MAQPELRSLFELLRIYGFLKDWPSDAAFGEESLNAIAKLFAGRSVKALTDALTANKAESFVDAASLIDLEWQRRRESCTSKEPSQGLPTELQLPPEQSRQLAEGLQHAASILPDVCKEIEARFGRHLIQILVNNDQHFSATLRRKLTNMVGGLPDNFSQVKESVVGDLMILMLERLRNGKFDVAEFPSASAWLSYLAVAAARRVIRRHQKYYARQEFETAEFWNERSADSTDLDMVEQVADELRTAIEQVAVDPTDRQIVQLLLDRLPFAEIAKVVGVVEANVRRRWKKIYERLLKWFEGEPL